MKDVAETYVLWVGWWLPWTAFYAVHRELGNPLPRYIYAVVACVGTMLVIVYAERPSAVDQWKHMSGGVASAYTIAVMTWRSFKWITIFGIGVFLVAIELALSRLLGGFRGKKISQVDAGDSTGAPLRQYQPGKAAHNFMAVDGMEPLKQQLREILVEVRTKGKNGIIFFGPPGNGKTFMAEAIAGEIGASFLSVSIAEIGSRWLGQTAEQLGAAFESASSRTPCVLFIDEIDSIITDRSVGTYHRDKEDTTNAFLTLVVKARSIKGLIVIGATNFWDKLDKAAVREGRFDYKIEIPAPDYAARLGLLSRFTAKGGSTLPVPVAERAARRWEGFSLVRITTVAERAAGTAVKRHEPAVDFPLLMETLREVQGMRGLGVPEGAPGIDDLSFDPDVKHALTALARRMRDIEAIEEQGGTVPKGVIFAGPPGTGKTAAARALAMASRWAFLPTTGQALSSSPDEIGKLIEKARDLRPCLVFIDESDDILQDRASNLYGKQATNKLLALMDGNIALHDVMFVAATNFAESLDAAMLRDGRFGEKITFTIPEADTTQAIVAAFLKEKAKTRWAADLTPVSAAEVLQGLAPSDIRGRLQAAINAAIGHGKEEVGLDDLRSVLRTGQTPQA